MKSMSKKLMLISLSSLLIATTVVTQAVTDKKIKNSRTTSQSSVVFEYPLPGEIKTYTVDNKTFKIYTTKQSDFKIDNSFSILDFQPGIRALPTDCYINMKVPSNVKVVKYGFVKKTETSKLKNSIVRVDFSDANVFYKIAGDTFREMTKLKEVVFNSNTSFIDSNAFKGCSSLNKLTNFENTKITNIQNSAFNACDILEINFPSTLTRVGNWALAGNKNLSYLDFSNTNIETISLSSFNGDNIKHAYFPNTLTSIGFNSFLSDAASPTLLENINLPKKFYTLETLQSIGIRNPDNTSLTENSLIKQNLSFSFDVSKFSTDFKNTVFKTKEEVVNKIKQLTKRGLSSYVVLDNKQNLLPIDYLRDLSIDSMNQIILTLNNHYQTTPIKIDTGLFVYSNTEFNTNIINTNLDYSKKIELTPKIYIDQFIEEINIWNNLSAKEPEFASFPILRSLGLSVINSDYDSTIDETITLDSVNNSINLKLIIKNAYINGVKSTTSPLEFDIQFFKEGIANTPNVPSEPQPEKPSESTDSNEGEGFGVITKKEGLQLLSVIITGILLLLVLVAIWVVLWIFKKKKE